MRLFFMELLDLQLNALLKRTFDQAKVLPSGLVIYSVEPTVGSHSSNKRGKQRKFEEQQSSHDSNHV